MIIAVEDKSYRCKDCDSFGQCEYYNNRRPTSHICKEFTNDSKVAEIVVEILDKISAEIDEKISHYEHFSASNTANGLMIAKEIIGKYKGDKEC